MLSLMIRTGLRRMDVIQATLGALSQRDGHTVLSVDVVRTLEAWREAVRPLREETPTTPLFCGLARQGRGEQCRYIIGREMKPMSEKAI
jgi:hypothetical protein